MGKKIQKRGKCIFCEGYGLTHQHVLPNWLREYFPRTEKDTKTQNLLYYERFGESLVATPKIRKTQGHLGNVRIRNVCEQCNSGWISRLEKDVKPIVEELLKGNMVGLNKERQEALARWIILVNIMIEFTDIKTMAIPENDRKMIKNGIIPEGWKLWIGYCDSENWKFRYRHNGAKIMNRSDYESDHSVPNSCNVQFTTIGLGKLYIHAVRNCLESLNPLIDNLKYFGLMQIYPFVNDIPITLVPKYISDADADVIPDMIFNQIAKRGGKDIETVYIDPSNLMR